MRLAVIGLGFMGSMHLKAIRQNPSIQLRAVYSSDEKKLTGDLTGIQGNIGGPGEKEDFSSVAKYTRIEDLLADPEIEAVDICLPTDLHEPVALQALRAGKHVLVEKPIALGGEGADEILRTAKQQGRTLMAAQVLRFLPEYVALREAVRSGSLGSVRNAVLRRRCAAPAWSGWLKDPQRSGGGVFDLLIHDVDFALHLFGTPQAVSATGHENLPRGIDILHGTLHYGDGLTVLISGGWHHLKAYPFSMEYTVVGDAATADYSSAGRAPALYHENGTETTLPLSTRDGFAAELEYFARCVDTGAAPELCPPAESAAAVKLMRLLLTARSRPGELLPCQI